jgi:hypothetical protein
MSFVLWISYSTLYERYNALGSQRKNSIVHEPILNTCAALVNAEWLFWVSQFLYSIFITINININNPHMWYRNIYNNLSTSTTRATFWVILIVYLPIIQQNHSKLKLPQILYANTIINETTLLVYVGYYMAKIG